MPRAPANFSIITLAHHRDCLDFDLGTVFDECRDLDERHRREMPANHRAVGFADLAKASEIFVLVGDIPGETHDALGPRAGLGQYGDDVGQRLPTWTTKSSLSNCCSLFQPIWPATQICRPSATTPLEKPLARRQCFGFRSCMSYWSSA